MRCVLLALLLLAGCSGGEDTPTANAGAAPTELETAAIEAGVIPDPASTDITGLYARETDKVCVAPSATAYRIGVSVDYGDDQSCAGSGTVTREGETLDVDFTSAAGCSFNARFEGDKIVFPGSVPDACGKLCRGRASIAGLALDRLSDSVSEASTMRDGKGTLLCGGD